MRRGLGFLLGVSLFGCASAPAASGGARSQFDVTLPLTPAAALARVQSVYADSGVTIERADPTLVVGAMPERSGMGDRVGTKVRVHAALIPVGRDSTRVVMTGTIDTPQAGVLPAETIRVSEENRRQGALGKRVWARMQGLAAALAATVGGQ